MNAIVLALLVLANTGDHRDGLILIWIRACYTALQWCDCYTYLSTERCPNIYSTNPGAADPIARVLLLYKGYRYDIR